MLRRTSKAAFYVLLTALVVVFLPPFVKYQELRYKNRKLDEQMRRLKADQKRMEVEQQRLETDISYIERVARDQTGLARKGEIVLKEVPAKKK